MGANCCSMFSVSSVRNRLEWLVNPNQRPRPKDRSSRCFSRSINRTSTMEVSVISIKPHPISQSNSSDSADANQTPKGGKRKGNKMGDKKTTSLESDANSTVCPMSGIDALATLTVYETKLIPQIWKSCLTADRHYCEHVISRLFSQYPELEDAIGKVTVTRPITPQICPRNDQLDITTINATATGMRMNDKARHLARFFRRLIIEHQLDYDGLLRECSQLGRTHAKYFYDGGLRPGHWDALGCCLVQEYKKMQVNCDLSIDEKDLQLLCWTHFAMAIVAAIKEAFEEEIKKMSVSNAVE